MAPKAVGDYASGKLEEAKAKRERAADQNNGLNDQERQQLLKEANELNEAWKEGGYARVALHTLVGGLIGDLAGAIGAGTTAAVMPSLADQIAALDIPVEVKQALIMGLGAAIGGATGGTAGAGTGLSETANNYLKHTDIDKFKKELSDCKAKNCTVAEKRAIAEKWKAISDKQQDEFLDETLATGIDPNPKALYYVIMVPFSTGINDPDIQDIVTALDNQNSYVKWLEISESAATLVGNATMPVARGGLLVKANSNVKEKLPAGVEVKTESVAPLNKKMLDENPSFQPSYLPGTKAYTYTTPPSGDKFVRVYVDNGKTNNQVASWMMRESDINGLSPEQIKDKFALSQVPTHITNVNVPATQTMRASTANGILGNGGGGVQFEVLGKPDSTWFENPRRLK